MMDNRKRVKRNPPVVRGDDEIVLDTGFICVSPDNEHYRMRPDRGSGGYAVYSTAAGAARSRISEQETVVKVQIVMREV